MTLYELMNIYNEYSNMLMNEEISDQDFEDLGEFLVAELESKGVGISFVVAKLESEISSLKEWNAVITKKKKATENNLDRVKNMIRDTMINMNVDSIKTDFGKLGLRKPSKSVVITDVDKLPKEYTIVEVKSSDPGAVNGMPEAHKSVSEDYTFVIKAQLRIPKIFQHSCKSYSQKTSWDVLRNLAKELKLGFSSNEKSTNDVMTWICPNISNEHFISEVVNSSWKSEEDSFEWWVDPYYNLTFVNMNKQLFGPDSRGVDYEVVRMQMGTGQEITGGFNSNQKAGDEEIPLILTNEPYRSKYPFFITNYKVENNSGYVVNKFGYKTILQFYDTSLVSDSPKNKYSKYAIESLTPKDFNDGEIILRGRPNEKIYQDEYKKEWLGTKYFENTHTNIHQAPKQNLLNKVENYKIILQIELNSYVPWIYRGQLIPVHIVHGSSFDAAGQKGPALANAAEKPGESVLNRFLSGKYIILGTSIEFKDAKLKTILRLGKRQWTINDGIASIPEPLTT
jgi:hypothetical protein